jgi:uncharacterized protein YjbI with pentapeptide repeats
LNLKNEGGSVIIDSDEKMSNQEHVEIVKEGAAKIARWRMEHPDQRLDLSHASLGNGYFGGSQFIPFDSGINLNGADLSGADLRHAYLVATSLVGANLQYADIARANLSPPIFVM